MVAEFLRCHLEERGSGACLVESLVANQDTGGSRLGILVHPRESHTGIDSGSLAPRAQGTQDTGIKGPTVESDLDPNADY